jgi:hypothetical protein
MSRLPTVYGDGNTWGTVLNDYLGVTLTGCGTLKTPFNLSTNSTMAGVWYDPTTNNCQARYIFRGTDMGSHVGITAATVNIIAEQPTGSGSNGPLSSDMALILHTIKKNWQSSNVEGQVDGMYIVGRQGSRGDIGGITVDVGAWDSSSYLVTQYEGASAKYTATGSTIVALNSQMGTLYGRGTEPGYHIGFQAMGIAGSLTAAFRVVNINNTYWDVGYGLLGGKVQYGIVLSDGDVTYASMALPNDRPIKQMDNTAYLRDLINLNATNNLMIGANGINDAVVIPAFRVRNSMHLEVTPITGDTTLTESHCAVTVDATINGVILTLPQASVALNRVYWATKIDATGNTMRITPPGTERLNGVNGYLEHTTPWQTVRIVAVASGYWVSNVLAAG